MIWLTQHIARDTSVALVLHAHHCCHDALCSHFYVELACKHDCHMQSLNRLQFMTAIYQLLCKHVSYIHMSLLYICRHDLVQTRPRLIQGMHEGLNASFGMRTSRYCILSCHAANCYHRSLVVVQLQMASVRYHMCCRPKIPLGTSC